MKSKVDPFSAEGLKLPDEMIPTKRVTPKKILERRQQFVKFPMDWYEVLLHAKVRTPTWLMAIYLLHQDWKHRHKPFKLPNGMLGEDKVSRWRKYRSLESVRKHQ